MPRQLTVKADDKEFEVTVRIDTPKEQRYFRHGGILQFVLRELLPSRASTSTSCLPPMPAPNCCTSC